MIDRRWHVLRKRNRKDYYWTLEWCTNSYLFALWLVFYYRNICKYEAVEIRKVGNDPKRYEWKLR